jgi:hypothetical protein
MLIDGRGYRHNGRVELAAKLQIKPGQRVAVLAAGAEIPAGLLDGLAVVGSTDDADVVIAFATGRADLTSADLTRAVEAARADRLTWIAYPKAGQLGTDLNRDILRDALAARAVQPVRQVALDPVWSALRFRPA